MDIVLALVILFLIAITVIIIQFRYIHVLRKQNKLWQSSAYDDKLTGLGNRRRYDDYLPRMVAHALRAGKALTLLFVDINKLKPMNDTHGYKFGDQLIVLVANALRRSAARPMDLVCRLGGDEFTVVLPDTDLEGARSVCERIVRELASEDLPIPGGIALVSASIGGTSIEIVNGSVRFNGGTIPRVSFRQRTALPNLVAQLTHEADLRMLKAKKDLSVRSPIHLS